MTARTGPLEGTARIVEGAGGLWHLRRDGEQLSLCGRDATHWPPVLHWDTRLGITCGACLFAAGLRPAPSTSSSRG